MTAGPIGLSLREVGMRYPAAGDAPAVLRDINLEIPAGDYLVIVGRSGSGKSTLLNLLGCLDQPTEGEVLIGDRVTRTLTETELAGVRRRDIGFVFQSFNLIPTLTVRENLLVPLQLNGADPEAAVERVLGLLAAAGLQDCGARFPEELSGGEQQRVAIMRAIAHEPAVLIADEPTGNLDLPTARLILELLESFGHGQGRTLIMATHSREVMGRAQRVLEISEGRLREVGTAGSSS
ncbi:MAG: ABC transporter ATP-binding protein [Gammaproteobacteria bacterium]